MILRKAVFIVTALTLGCFVAPSSAGASTTRSHHAKKAPAGNGTGPSSPLPLGRSATVDGWRVHVVSLVAETGADPVTRTTAPAGYVFEVYTIQGTRVDKSPGSIISLVPELLGATRVTRNADSNPLCYGGSPDNGTAYKGGTLTDSACISVKSKDAAGKIVMQLGEVQTAWFATK